MESKSGNKTGSKPNLNESTLPLLEEQEGKGETPEKEEKIEMEMKGNDAEKEDKNGEKGKEEDAKGKKKKEKKEKKPKEKKEGTASRTPLVCAQNFTVGLNVHDRDEKKINDHVNLTFEDIIGETDANQGFEFIWRLTYLLFNGTRFWFYRILAALLAIPFALGWALIFAFVNITTVWFCTPTLRVFDVLMFHVHRFWSGLVRTFLDPIFQSLGLCFGSIRTKHEHIGSPVTTA